ASLLIRPNRNLRIFAFQIFGDTFGYSYVRIRHRLSDLCSRSLQVVLEIRFRLTANRQREPRIRQHRISYLGVLLAVRKAHVGKTGLESKLGRPLEIRNRFAVLTVASKDDAE